MSTQAIMANKDEIIKFQQEQISLLQEENAMFKTLVASLQEENVMLKALVASLQEENAMFKERIEELEKRLGLDSTTSSKPPSTEGLNKKSRGQRTTSLRNSNKTFGGQVGHQGKTLEQEENPDYIQLHQVTICHQCQADLTNVNPELIIKRQVIDAEIKRTVTEHQAEMKRCSCGACTTASFPEGVKAPIQIGNNLRAFGLYLSGQFIAKDRLSMVMEDIFGVSISDTTLIKYEKQLSKNLIPCYQGILEQIRKSFAKHRDESGLRVGGKTGWIQVLCTKRFTYLWFDAKRKSLIELGEGACVHDHYKPYLQQEITHAFCNAHHSREFKALIIHEKEEWASEMYTLLQIMHRSTQGEKNLPPQKVEFLERAYDKILQRGLDYHEGLAPPLSTRQSPRGRKKRRIGHNLLLRLKTHKAGTLLFLSDPRIPFTNNQAERDIRMVKIKQKVSGCLRTEAGAHDFAVIRSFIGTVRKHQLNILDSIKLALHKKIEFADIFPMEYPQQLLLTC